MSEYAAETETSVRARRKRRRSLITLGGVLLGLFFAFWYALSYYRAAGEAGAAFGKGGEIEEPEPVRRVGD